MQVSVVNMQVSVVNIQHTIEPLETYRWWLAHSAGYPCFVDAPILICVLYHNSVGLWLCVAEQQTSTMTCA